MPDTESTRLIYQDTVEGEASQKTIPKIVSISYHRLKNLGNYENERLEAIAQVQEGDNLEETILGLREFVSGQLSLLDNLRSEVIGYRSQRFTLIDEIKHFQEKLEDLKGRWIEAKKVLAAHGVEVEELACFEQPKTLIDEAQAIEFPPGAVPVGVFDDDNVPPDDDEGWVEEEDDDDDDDDDSPW